MNLNLSFLNYSGLLNNCLLLPSSIDHDQCVELKRIVRQGDCFRIDKAFSEEQKNKIHTYFDRLIDTKPGAALIGRLIKHQKVIELKPIELKWMATIRNEEFSVSLDLGMKFFEYSIDEKENLRVEKSKKTCLLAHELLHILHVLDRTLRPLNEKFLLDSSYENEEEQYTITGLFQKQGTWIFDPLCENTFHKALGSKSYRVTHYGYAFKKSEKGWSFIDTLQASQKVPLLVDTLIRDIKEDKVEINKPVFAPFVGKRIRPLTAAIMLGQVDIIKALVENPNLEVNYEDFCIGNQRITPFALAMMQNLDWAFLLTKSKQFDVDWENSKGNTALADCLDLVNMALSRLKGPKLDEFKEKALPLLDALQTGKI